MRTSQTSPGTIRINTNTSTAAPKRVGIVSNNRLTMYWYTLPPYTVVPPAAGYLRGGRTFSVRFAYLSNQIWSRDWFR